MIHRVFEAAAKSYIRAELPKWGSVIQKVVGDDADWRNAPTISDRNKLFGFVTDYDLSRGGERALYYLGRWSELPAQLLLTCFPEGLVVDVGANRGDFTLPAACICQRVISFEPNPEMVAFLKRDIERNNLNNVTVCECGLSDEQAELPLNIPAFGPSGASFGQRDTERTTAKVPIRAGDDELHGESPVFIKIDVEGYEVRAVRGLAETIRRSQPVILTEVIDELLEGCGNSRAELNAFMASLGYRGYEIGFARNGLTHGLAYNVASTDILWLPRGRSPDEFRPTMRDLKRRARSRRLDY